MYLTQQRDEEPLPNPELDKVVELVNLLEEVEVFSFEGVMFLGNKVEAVKRYMALRPSKKFFIWLQDNYKMLHTSA